MTTLASDFVRFLQFVEISESHDCWEWQGNCPGGRHGHFALGPKTVKAHRWIFELLNGPIQDGLVIRHKCDNPKCVNPLHLEQGTLSDNTRDAVKRGRWPDRSGEKHPLAKVNEKIVRAIRRDAELGRPQSQIADCYGISRGQVQKIIHRINWDHI